MRTLVAMASYIVGKAVIDIFVSIGICFRGVCIEQSSVFNVKLTQISEPDCMSERHTAYIL